MMDRVISHVRQAQAEAARRQQVECWVYDHEVVAALARRDAIGRVSRHDVDAIYKALYALAAAGEVSWPQGDPVIRVPLHPPVQEPARA